MELCLEVPRKKYTSTGQNDVYNPTTAGTDANKPYAIPTEKKSSFGIVLKFN